EHAADVARGQKPLCPPGRVAVPGKRERLSFLVAALRALPGGRGIARERRNKAAAGQPRGVPPAIARRLQRGERTRAVRAPLGEEAVHEREPVVDEAPRAELAREPRGTAGRVDDEARLDVRTRGIAARSRPPEPEPAACERLHGVDSSAREQACPRRLGGP